MDWTHTVIDRDQWKTIVNTVIKFHVPKDPGGFWSSLTTCGFSRRIQFRGVSYYVPTKCESPRFLGRYISVYVSLVMAVVIGGSR
jgi:hypothetical protein